MLDHESPSKASKDTLTLMQTNLDFSRQSLPPRHAVRSPRVMVQFLSGGARSLRSGIVCAVGLGLSLAVQAGAALELALVDGKPTGHVVASYEKYDNGGNTSVAFESSDEYKWSGDSPFPHDPAGYFDASGREIAYVKRDRDLGQTFAFTGDGPRKLKAITVRTGFGTNVVRPGMFDAAVSLQLFEVTGTPVLHRNGSEGDTEAFHGFPHDRVRATIPAERDDYLTGETYTSLGVFSGARFPSRSAFGLASDSEPVSAAHPAFKGRYLRFELAAGSRSTLHPGRTYAFLIMIDEAGPERGFTLANQYSGGYEGGHGIRREGNGTFPPAAADPRRDFSDPVNRQALEAARLPRDFSRRTAISPGTNGYPDVCTWRDLVFFVVVE